MKKTANDRVYCVIDCFFWCCCSYLYPFRYWVVALTSDNCLALPLHKLHENVLRTIIKLWCLKNFVSLSWFILVQNLAKLMNRYFSAL